MSGDAHRGGDDRPSTGEGDETLLPGPGTELGVRTSMAANRTPVPKGIGVTLYGKTHVGLVREHNEDNFMVGDLGDREGPRPGGEVVSGAVSECGIAMAVCDGMGGAAAGEVASQMAVDTLFQTLLGDGAPEDRDSFASRLVDSIEAAGARIYRAAKKDRTRRGMGTTATVAGLVDKVLFVGQVGDSRCYILREGRLTLITKDQSLVNQLIEAGQLTEDEAQVFEHSNIILQALGTTEQVVVDLTFVELRRGDRVLLCSDGLSGLITDAAIETEMARIRRLPQLVDSLIDLANAAGGHDNITCIVADFDGEALDPAEEGAVPFYQQYPLPRGQNERSAAGPALPHVVKSMVPRSMQGARTSLEDYISDPPRHGSFSWTTAASVVGLLGLAAVVAIASAGQRRAAAPDSLEPPLPVFANAEVPVEVKVRAAVDDGELYVNGQSYGPLRDDESILLRLPPGAYHFEAREVDGTQVGKDIVVEPGQPTEVDLIPPGD